MHRRDLGGALASLCVRGAATSMGLGVLDIASGEGYGSSLLGASAKSVDGVDIDRSDSVDKARARYESVQRSLS